MPGVMDRHRASVARVIAKWKTGEVTLTRVTRADPDPETPWIPGAPTFDVYALDARVDGVASDLIDGTTIIATDLVVIASPQARHTLSDGEAASGAVVDIVPTIADTLTIDGEEKVIKKVQPYPAAGLAAMFHIFVARMSRAKRKRKERAERLHREPIVREIARILETGEPTRWRWSSACHRGLRMAMCANGLPWEIADQRAGQIVTLARHRIGLQIPSWQMAHGDAPQEVEYWFCQGCGGFMKANSRPYCSDECRGILDSRRYRSGRDEIVQVEAVRIILTGSAERQHGYQERQCRHCDAIFKPVKIRQRYCGQACYRAHSRRPARACLVCAEPFLPKHKTGLYCSRVCCDEHWRQRAQQQRALQRELRCCHQCGSDFMPTDNRQLYCSKTCGTKAESARRRAKAHHHERVTAMAEAA